jgi:hypothetical protein
MKKYKRKKVKSYKAISEELDGNCQLHASAFLTLGKQPPVTLSIAGYMNSRGDPDDAAEKRKSLSLPGVELSDRPLPKLLMDI